MFRKLITRKYSLPEIVGDTGIYVPYNDPNVTAEAIMQTLESKGVKAKKKNRKIFRSKS